MCSRKTMRDTKPVTRHWTPIPAHWREQACTTPGSILLESSLPSDIEHCSILFTDPGQVLTAASPEDIPALFRSIENALANGKWAAGHVTYEAGTHFLELPAASSGGPLATFALYDRPQIFNHHEDPASATPRKSTQLDLAPMPLTSVAEYTQAIHQIHEWITAGETYQLNYTTQLQTPCPHTPLEVYEALQAEQPSSYAAILHLANHPAILSFSPELFFRVDSDGLISTKPMKGTAPRGTTADEDQQLAQALQQDEKNRAEHVMIVDLLRNDLNRICRTGTVRADDLFRIEQYATLHQMTSRVSGMLQKDTLWYEVFRALFPGGSITGAPKRHTAQLIQQIERTPRGVYTGAIGYFAPNRTAAFNIAIRTAVLHPDPTPNSRHPERNEVESKHLLSSPSVTPQRETATLTLGVGGGIVADSTATSEYNEALLKASFVQQAAHPYQLIETMRAGAGIIPFLEAHLQRLAASAEALGFACNTDRIRNELTGRNATGRVRLQLHRSGETSIAVTAAPAWPAKLHLILSTQRTDGNSPHLRHKTTYRPEYSTTAPHGFQDTLFQNTRGHLTESTIANLLVAIEGRWYTPPLHSGVLPGIMRSHLLRTGQLSERTITMEDLQQSTAAALCNAVRGVARIASLQLPGGKRIRWRSSATLPDVTP